MATVTPLPPRVARPPARPRAADPFTARPRFWAAAGAPVLVLTVAVTLAALNYAHFLTVHRSLWYGGAHDRNMHYYYGLRLATDARDGRIFDLLEDLNGARIWPPLHGVLVAGVLLVGGLHSSLAVLPSLAGWVAAVVFAFLVARRAVPRGGTLAGLAAVVFLLASPAYRAFSTDVMLESLGAGLSLMAVHAYLVAVQDRGRHVWAGRWLGLSLTLLFVHKYNYWMLVVLALAATTLLDQSAARRRSWWDAVRGFELRRWLAAELRRPSNLLLVILLAVVAAVIAHGDRPVELGSWSFSLYPPHNIINLAYLVVFYRLVRWWREGGRQQAARVDAWCCPVIRWHLWFVAVWFLLPKHLGYFISFVSPANAPQGERLTPLLSARTYLGWVTTEYHLGAASVVLALILFAVALLAYRRLRPGGQAVLWLVLFGFALASLHPNQKERYLHSWLLALWVGAGIGLATLTYGRLTRYVPAVRPWLATAALAGLLALHGPGLASPGHAAEGGPHLQDPSALDLTDFYLPELDGARRCTILSAVAFRPVADWTFLQRYGSLDRQERNWFGWAGDGLDNRAGFARWLRTTTADTIVYLGRRPGPFVWEDVGECKYHAEVADLLGAQTTFVKVKEKEFPYLSCAVTVWKRVSP